MNLTLRSIQLLPFVLLLIQAPAYTAAFRWYSLGNWIEEEGTSDLAGQAVATSRDGSMIAVSAPHYTPGADADADEKDSEDLSEGSGNLGQRNGRVVVYRFDEIRDSWDKVGTDIVGNPGDNFGTSLAMSEDGSSIIVGLKNDNDNGKDAGSVQVFILDKATGNEQWVQKGQTLLGKNALDEFGSSVDISAAGVVIAVGSPGRDIGQDKNEAGVVQVYRWDDVAAKWEQIAGDIEGRGAYDHFGASVSLSKVGRLAIGAPTSNNSEGYVLMIEYDSDNKTWDEMGSPVHANAVAGDLFGTAVSMSFDGSSVAVGCPHHNGQGGGLKHSGEVTVHVFDEATKNWTLRGGALSGFDSGDLFGSSVSLSDDGNELAVGAPKNSNKAGSEAGDVVIYHFKDNEWDDMDLEVEGKSAYNHLGASVAISGEGFQVIAGAPEEGYATVYVLAKTAPPTQSPTEGIHNKPEKKPDGSEAPSRGRSGFGTFILVIFIIAVCGGVGFAVFKGVVYLKNKRSSGNLTAFEPTARNELEMREHSIPGPDDDGSGGTGVV